MSTKFSEDPIGYCACGPILLVVLILIFAPFIIGILVQSWGVILIGLIVVGILVLIGFLISLLKK